MTGFGLDRGVQRGIFLLTFGYEEKKQGNVSEGDDEYLLYETCDPMLVVAGNSAGGVWHAAMELNK